MTDSLPVFDPARPPGAVTDVSPDPRRAGSVRVSVAGSLYCTVALEDVQELGLRAGMPIDAGLHQRLGAAADREAAYRTVLRSLAARASARTALARRLVRKGHPADAVEAALDRAAGLGLIDDARYAQHYVQTRAARGRGPARLRRDLLVAGVARPLVDRAINEQWPDGVDPDTLPRELAERRARQLGDLPRPVKRRRLLAYLARRGFSGYEITDLVADVLR